MGGINHNEIICLPLILFSSKGFSEIYGAFVALKTDGIINVLDVCF